MDAEPIIFRFDDLGYRYLQDEYSDSINEKNKEIILTCGGSFQYTKDLNLDLNKAIKITLNRCVMNILSALLVISLLCLLLYYRFNRAKIHGAWGEKKVSVLLSVLGKEYHVFNDILIKTSYGTSQIDHLVVSPYGIFVIETKNYKGWIFGGVNSDRWTQSIWGNKYKLANPIHQNLGHIKALINVLPQFCTNQYISIIVFSHKAKLKVKCEESYNVIHSWNLIHRIHKYKDIVLSDEQQEEYMSALLSFLDTPKQEKKAHVSSVKQKKSHHDSLISSGICPKCGGSLIKRKGKYGSFYGCSNYPNCKFISN